MPVNNEAKLEATIPDGPKTIITEFWYLPDSPSEITTVHACEFSEGKVPGLAIADSGCRNAVGGKWWHADYQRALTRLQIPFEEVQEHEIYRFGAGDSIISRKAFIYPVSVHGVHDIIRMSMVGEDAKACPGLIGPSELSRWGASGSKRSAWS